MPALSCIDSFSSTLLCSVVWASHLRAGSSHHSFCLADIKRRLQNASNLLHCNSCVVSCNHVKPPEADPTLSCNEGIEAFYWVCTHCGCGCSKLLPVCPSCRSEHFQGIPGWQSAPPPRPSHQLERALNLPKGLFSCIPSVIWCYSLRRLVFWATALLPYAHRLQSGFVASPPMTINNNCIVWVIEKPKWLDAGVVYRFSKYIPTDSGGSRCISLHSWAVHVWNVSRPWANSVRAAIC